MGSGIDDPGGDGSNSLIVGLAGLTAMAHGALMLWVGDSWTTSMAAIMVPLLVTSPILRSWMRAGGRRSTSRYGARQGFGPSPGGY